MSTLIIVNQEVIFVKVIEEGDMERLNVAIADDNERMLEHLSEKQIMGRKCIRL